MKLYQYQSQQLVNLLESLQKQKISGALYINAQVNPGQKQRSRVLVRKNGEITYANLKVPSVEEFAKILFQKLNSDLINTALKLVVERATNKTSVREILGGLIKTRVWKWEQFETLFQAQVVSTLEQVLPYPGELKTDPKINLDLCYGETCHGFDRSLLISQVNQRQKEWTALAPTIPSMDAVPYFPENVLEKISDRATQQHLKQWVDGVRSLLDIAEKCDRDALELAKSYSNWVQASWVTFKGSTSIASIPKSNASTANLSTTSKNLPTILSVDDSPIVRTMIKRTLEERYNVLLASNAVDAFQLLKQQQIALLILDVTMPDIDGLEMCRTLRSIPQFRDLPAIMLTARDKFTDQLKGRFAGSTEYLTKPFDAEKLFQVVNKYINLGNTYR